MKDNREIMCDECKNNVPVEQIRYGIKGTQHLRLCSDCRDRTTPRSSRSLGIKKIQIPQEPKSEVKVEKKISNFNSNKDDYLCTRCKYKFKHDRMSEGKLKCPYCASVAYVTSTKSLFSDKILENINDFD